MTKFTVGSLVGVLILLVGCLFTFEGAMVPAMWQLTSMIWIIFWSGKCLKERD